MANDCAPVIHGSTLTRVPEDIRCLHCEQLYIQNQTFEMIQEDLGGEQSKFRTSVHRWYMLCTKCSSQIIFRTNLLTHAYVLEYGAVSVDDYAVSMQQRNLVPQLPDCCDPEKFLKKFEDTVPSMMIEGAIECTLDFIKRSESVGNVSDHEIYIQGAQNIQNKTFPNKCPHFVIRTDDKIFMSPFVKLLTKVTWNHLPNFLKELRDFLTTDKYSGIVFAGGEPNKRGKDKVAIPGMIRVPVTNEPFLEAIGKFAMRNMKPPLSTALLHHPAVFVPFNMQCTKCSNTIRKGDIYSMIEESFGENSPVINMKLIRFYMECPKCEASLVFRSDFRHTKFIKEYGVLYAAPSNEEKADEKKEQEEGRKPLDPVSLLSKFPKITEAKRKVIDDLENALYEFRSEMENSIVDVWTPKVKKEIEEEKEKNNSVPIITMEKKSIRPFAETMGMVPETHCKRFYVSLLHQLSTEQFIAKTTRYFEPFLVAATSENFLNALKQWWKKIHYSNLLAPKLTMVPFGMKCKKCSNSIYKGKKLDMIQEILGDGSDLLRMKMYRFYMNCPHCSSSMIFRSNLQQTGYIKEYGIELLPEDSKIVEDDRPKERYCNPMRLLKQQRGIAESEKKLVGDIEENLDRINRSDETARIRVMTMIRAEIDNQMSAKYIPEPQCIRSWKTNPFSDTVQLVPDYHTSRFIQAILNQLETPEFLRVALKRKISVRDTYQKYIDSCERLHCTVSPASPTILPIHLKCSKCSKMTYMGTPIAMTSEVLQGLLSLPIKVYRYYFPCPHCSSQIIIRSDLADQDFRVEYGAEKVLKAKGKWSNQGVPNGVADPRNDIKRFVKDEKKAMDVLEEFEKSITRLMLEEDYSPDMQMMRARMGAEYIAGYIGTKHKVVAPEVMEKLLKVQSPYSLSITNIPRSGIFHTMMALRNQLLTKEFRSVVFPKNS